MNTYKNYKLEAQHASINFLMNLRYILYCKLTKLVGKKLSKKIATIIVRIIEIPVKWILH